MKPLNKMARIIISLILILGISGIVVGFIITPNDVITHHSQGQNQTVIASSPEISSTNLSNAVNADLNQSYTNLTTTTTLPQGQTNWQGSQEPYLPNQQDQSSNHHDRSAEQDSHSDNHRRHHD